MIWFIEISEKITCKSFASNLNLLYKTMQIFSFQKSKLLNTQTSVGFLCGPHPLQSCWTHIVFQHFDFKKLIRAHRGACIIDSAPLAKGKMFSSFHFLLFLFVSCFFIFISCHMKLKNNIWRLKVKKKKKKEIVKET